MKGTGSENGLVRSLLAIPGMPAAAPWFGNILVLGTDATGSLLNLTNMHHCSIAEILKEYVTFALSMPLWTLIPFQVDTIRDDRVKFLP